MVQGDTTRENGVRATFSVDEVAAKFGVGRDAIYEAARRKEIPSIRIGRRIVFARAAIDRILETAS